MNHSLPHRTDRRRVVRGVVPFVAAMMSVTSFMTATEAHAQIIHGQRPQVTQDLMYLSWTFTGGYDFTMAQWFIPVSVRAPLMENVELALSSGLSRSEADWEVTGDDISGLVDSRIQIASSFMEDQIVISGGVSLPTGKTGLTPEQMDLLEFMTADFLNFPVKNPGEGLNVFGEIGFAVPLGSWVFGAAGTAFIAGEYSPYDTELTYKPGSRYIGTVGIERGWEERHFFAADAVIIVSGNDEADGAVIFRDGTQVDLRLTGRVAIGKGSIEAGVRYILRGNDRRLSEDHTELIREVRNNNGDDLRLHLSPRIPIASGLALWLSYDGKMLKANEYEVTDGLFEDAAQVHGLGGGADIRLGKRAVARLGLRVWTGSSEGTSKSKGEPFDMSGYEVTERLTLTF